MVDEPRKEASPADLTPNTAGSEPKEQAQVAGSKNTPDSAGAEVVADAQAQQQPEKPAGAAQATGKGNETAEGEEKEEGFFGKNKFGIGAGILGMLLAMSLGGMGPIGALLIGVLAGGLIGGMADENSDIKGLFGGSKEPNYAAMEKDVEVQAQGKARVIGDDGKAIEGKDGKTVIVEKDGDVTKDYIIGEVKDGKFHIQEVGVVNAEGKALGRATPKTSVALPIGEDGSVDLGAEAGGLAELREGMRKLDSTHPKEEVAQGQKKPEELSPEAQEQVSAAVKGHSELLAAMGRTVTGADHDPNKVALTHGGELDSGQQGRA